MLFTVPWRVSIPRARDNSNRTRESNTRAMAILPANSVGSNREDVIARSIEDKPRSLRLRRLAGCDSQKVRSFAKPAPSEIRYARTLRRRHLFRTDTETIEQKLTDLECRMIAIEPLASQRKQKGAWREVIGWEEDDPLFREAVRLGAEWREKANAEGR